MNLAFKLRNGLTLRVRRWGRKEGLACVLIHGLAEGSFVWRRFAEDIAPYFKVVAVDLRGHGNSDKDERRQYTLDVYINDVREVLDYLNLKQYILVGHSLGGDIVAKLAATQPTGLLGLVLVDSGPSEGEMASHLVVREQILDGLRVYRTQEEYVAWQEARRFLATRRMLQALARDALTKTDAGYVLRYDPAVADILLGKIEDNWWWSVLPQCSCPTLVVRGIGSAVLPLSTCVRMASALVRGSVTTVPSAGHAVMTDNPDGFFKSVKSFLFQFL